MIVKDGAEVPVDVMLVQELFLYVYLSDTLYC